MEDGALNTKLMAEGDVELRAELRLSQWKGLAMIALRDNLAHRRSQLSSSHSTLIHLD